MLRTHSRPAGVSLLVMDLHLYVAGLYLERPTPSPNEILDELPTTRLVLHFQRDVPRTRLTDGFSEAFERAAPGNASQWERLERLNDCMEDMDEGSELIFDVVRDRGVVVTVAGERRGTVPSADFARVLLGNWLGPHAVDARVEAGVLGAPCD